jgi:hypothetical protein
MRSLAILLTLLAAGPASAGSLSIALRTPAGKPVANAVVTVRPQDYAGRGPIRFPWPYTMAQRNMQFEPFVLIVPVGAEVAFPNADPFKHHVFSFSPAKTFELKLYGREATRVVKFDKAGIVTLGCNIHDNMIAYVDVVDTPFVAKTSETGEAQIDDLPPGPAHVAIWHPSLRAPHEQVSSDLAIPASGTARLATTLDLRATALRRGGY